MRIYISGKITGLNYADVLKKFNDAQDLLESLGFEVINPLNNGLSQSHTWRQHIVRDVEILLPCDAIFMIGDWVESVGARCEYHIAQETGKIILYESNKNELLPFTKLIGDDKHKVWRVYKATLDVTNLRIDQYNGKVRTNMAFFARLILIYNMYNINVDIHVISNFINRSPGAIYHCIKKYKDEYEYNPNFRVLAQRVDNILKLTSDAKA
jgi:hypothetical protein